MIVDVKIGLEQESAGIWCHRQNFGKKYWAAVLVSALLL